MTEQQQRRRSIGEEILEAVFNFLNILLDVFVDCHFIHV